MDPIRVDPGPVLLQASSRHSCASTAKEDCLTSSFWYKQVMVLVSANGKSSCRAGPTPQSGSPDTETSRGNFSSSRTRKRHDAHVARHVHMRDMVTLIDTTRYRDSGSRRSPSIPPNSRVGMNPVVGQSSYCGDMIFRRLDGLHKHHRRRCALLFYN
jgi:hypothetical protein